MPIKILMPALSPTMEHGNIAKWIKQEGDAVAAGEVVLEVETDKATMEVEAVEEGILGKIISPEGTQDVPVNSLIAVLLEEGEDNSQIDKFIKEHNHNTTVNATVKDTSKTELNNTKIDNNMFTVDKDQPVPSPTHSSNIRQTISNQRLFASPLAKRIAQNKNIDLSSIVGTGPHGRIIKSDLQNYCQNTKPQIRRHEQEYSLIENSNMRKIIAKRLVQAKQTVPHFYLSIECIMDSLIEARTQINQIHNNDKERRLSVNDFIILASAKALKDVPTVNVSWNEDTIIQYNNIDISVAVAIKDGLITPIIRNADQKNISTISTEMKDLAKRAKENNLKLEEFQGGGFSISNLGMYGIKSFNAIINPPQGSILSVGMSSKRSVVVDDKLDVRTVMDVTLSCDHRVIDGAVGALFLNTFKKYIESPILMFI